MISRRSNWRHIFAAALATLLSVVPAAADPLSDGVQALEARRYAKALAFFNEARAANLNPNGATMGRVYCLAALGRPAEAVADARALQNRYPRSADALSLVAWALFRAGDDAGARRSYDGALRLAPNDASLANDAAWFLATSPSAAARDAGRALRLATFASERAKGKSAACLDTLAAAQASAGDFARAVETQRKAISLGDRSSSIDGQAFQGMTARLDAYLVRSAWHRRPSPGQ